MGVRLPCECIVYRTITRRSDIGRDDRPLANAFLRRKSPADSSGISVNYNVTVPDGCAPHLSRKKAIASLHVGRVRGVQLDDLSLDVIATSDTHANITGCPRQEDDMERALQVATELVTQSRVAWTA